MGSTMALLPSWCLQGIAFGSSLYRFPSFWATWKTKEKTQMTQMKISASTIFLKLSLVYWFISLSYDLQAFFSTSRVSHD